MEKKLGLALSCVALICVQAVSARELPNNSLDQGQPSPSDSTQLLSFAFKDNRKPTNFSSLDSTEMNETRGARLWFSSSWKSFSSSSFWNKWMYNTVVRPSTSRPLVNSYGTNNTAVTSIGSGVATVTEIRRPGSYTLTLTNNSYNP